MTPYIISLPERFNDRLLPLIDRLSQLGFDNPFIFPATKDANGAKGLILTVRKLFTELLLIDKPYFLILEDDVSFLREDPKKYIDICFEQLDTDFDCLYLGCNLWQNVNYLYSKNILQLYDAYGLQSVVYSKKGMIKILKYIDAMQEFIPLDVLIQRKIMPDGKCFASFPNITGQVTSYSDIEKKMQDWSNVLEKRFKEKTKHL